MRLNTDRLFIERAKRDWTMKDLAEHVGVSAQAVTAAVRKKKISASLAGKIARALDINVEELVIFED